jgi:hypothetical protein
MLGCKQSVITHKRLDIRACALFTLIFDTLASPTVQGNFSCE